MENEQKKRLEKFKKVSGYLLPLSSLAMVLFAFGAIIAIAIVLFKPVGETNIFAVADAMTLSAKIEGYNDILDWFLHKRLDWTAKIVLSLIFTSFTYFAIQAIFHFNGLLGCFYDGEIFNRNALTRARKAFRFNVFANLIFMLAYLTFLIISLSNPHQNIGARIEQFLDILIGVAIDFGFYCLVLWALEMGTELSEESELTI